jgi:anti-sigma-K factor RskA
MNPKPSKDVALNSGAYVLNALSDDERLQFESLMAESEDARAEATELADTAVVLGLSIEPVEPPTVLRARILDLVAQTPQWGPVEPATTVEPIDANPVDAASEAPQIGAAEERARRRWFTRPAVTLVAAAAAVALIFGGGVVVNSALQNSQPSATASQINQIQAASDYQRSTVKVATGGTATLIWSDSMGRSAIMVKNLESLPSSKTYELWYIDKNGPKPAGTFNSDGSLQAVVLDGKMGLGDTVGLTIEPSAGSKKPTTNPIVVVTTA